MKTLSIIFYIIGSIILIVSCFTSSVSATWWLGGISLVFLIDGCVCQFNANKNNTFVGHHNHY